MCTCLPVVLMVIKSGFLRILWLCCNMSFKVKAVIRNIYSKVEAGVDKFSTNIVKVVNKLVSNTVFSGQFRGASVILVSIQC